MKRVPLLLIAGTHSGAGKTTIATALMAAFARRGLRVQPFKVGPDFIDPGFHEVACGTASRNLDGWMLSRETNLRVFDRASAGSDLAIIEGVMGLFDGRSAEEESGSSAEMAKWLGAPVMLVADASAMARSAAALVGGFENFDRDVNVAGVLFNRIGGARHASLLRDSAAKYCRAKTMGCLPRSKDIELPSRHLGLTMARESLTKERLDAMTNWVEANVDLDAVLALASSHARTVDPAPRLAATCARGVRIGVARDAAFCFYYQDNLDLLEREGAELVPFSPMSDAALPEGIAGLYLGGGYPELHGGALSRNESLLRDIREFAQAGGPVYAECGGFMYLTEGIVDAEGREYAMAGVFPTRARMQARLAALGYLQPEATADALWARGCEGLRGHEFRYSQIDPMPNSIARAYREPIDGYRVNSVFGTYLHLHFLSDPRFGQQFLEHCAQWALTKTK